MYSAGVNGAVILVWAIVGFGVGVVVGLGALVYHWVA